MCYSYCLDKKHSLKVNKIIKSSNIVGFFKLNLTISCDSLLRIKTFLTNLGLNVVVCKKNKFIKKITTLIKGCVILVFNFKSYNFNVFNRYFFDFFNRNFPIISLCFFIFKRFMYLDNLMLFDFDSKFNSFISYFFSLLKYLVLCISFVLK
jgi:hypothetical protein